MNRDSEQVDGILNIIKDQDQPLKGNKLYNTIINVLGKECTTKESFERGKHYLKYTPENGKTILMLVKAVTYLGNPHPIYKKRIQIPKWWIDFVNTYENEFDVRFIGVYHYDNMVILSDFDINTYKNRMVNNSSAHVYTNDLYQAVSYGVFTKRDQYDNLINTVSVRCFKDYLNGKLPNSYTERQQIFDVFREFNDTFVFDQSLRADQAITEMKNGQWSKWREAEWGGFYVEYKFCRFLENNGNYTTVVCYIQNKKKDGQPDLDLYFPASKFYGDIKSSDSKNKDVLGNDKETIMRCLNEEHRVWYVVYQHDTVHDRDVDGNPMTRFRNQIIGKTQKPLSYLQKMKHSVTYRRMTIYEINRANYGTILKDFNQGHQPDGKPRKVKIAIKKKEADNYVVYRYSRGN